MYQAMLALPPAQCCTIGVKHEGTASGEIKKIGETSTYFAFPPDKKTHYAVIILTDVIGHESINPQLIADQFAANGYFVVMPDLFHGDAVPLSKTKTKWNGRAWLQNHMADRVDPVVTAVIKEMRTTYKVQRLGAVGYCFGGKYAIRFLGKTGHENGALVDASFVAHPSYVTEEEFSAINGPLSIAAAESDNIFLAEHRHKAEKILKDLCLGPKKVGYQINLYSYVEHGFATRADLSDKRSKFAKEQAFLQAVQWMDHFLKDGPDKSSDAGRESHL